MRRTKVEDDLERRESKKRGKRRKRREGRSGDLREWREELAEVRKGKGLEAGREEKAGW